MPKISVADDISAPHVLTGWPRRVSNARLWAPGTNPIGVLINHLVFTGICRAQSVESDGYGRMGTLLSMTGCAHSYALVQISWTSSDVVLGRVQGVREGIAASHLPQIGCAAKRRVGIRCNNRSGCG